MPKFLAGFHFSEEKISRHLKKNIRYWPIQIIGNKFATGQILKNPVEVVKRRILAGWAQKSPETWSMVMALGSCVKWPYIQVNYVLAELMRELATNVPASKLHVSVWATAGV